MRLYTSALLTALAAASLHAQTQIQTAPTLRLNQIQVVGTHNSYQMPADPRVMRLMAPRLKPLFDGMTKSLTPEQAAAMKEEHPNPLTDSFADALDYIQAPLQMQLRAGVRSLELDLQPDPQGGIYADPLPYRELRAAGEHDLAPLYEQDLHRPGMKVFHMADVDFRSQCPLLTQCLTLLRQWSDSNPGHTPVFILLEPKLSGLDKVVPGTTHVPPFDQTAFDKVDRAIVTILGRDRLVTPDDLRGQHKTLEEAALANAWPTLDSARGKFVFLYLVPGMNLKAFAPYLEGNASLEGRVAFVEGKPGMAHTAFLLIDNATAKPGRVEDFVRKGYIVRSRADIDTWEARHNETSRRDATLATGAQIISTDYPLAPNIYGNTYQVKPFAEGFRPNPINTK